MGMRELRGNPFDAGDKALTAARVHFDVIGPHATFARLEPVVRHQLPALHSVWRRFSQARVIGRVQSHADGFGRFGQRADGFTHKRENPLGTDFELRTHDLSGNVANEFSHFAAHLGSISLVHALEATNQRVDWCYQRIEPGTHVAACAFGADSFAGDKALLVTCLPSFFKQFCGRWYMQLLGEQIHLVGRRESAELLACRANAR